MKSFFKQIVKHPFEQQLTEKLKTELQKPYNDIETLQQSKEQ